MAIWANRTQPLNISSPGHQKEVFPVHYSPLSFTMLSYHHLASSTSHLPLNPFLYSFTFLLLSPRILLSVLLLVTPIFLFTFLLHLLFLFSSHTLTLFSSYSVSLLLPYFFYSLVSFFFNLFSVPNRTIAHSGSDRVNVSTEWPMLNSLEDQ